MRAGYVTGYISGFSQALVLYTITEVLMYFSDRQGEFRKRTTKNVLTPVKLRGCRS